MELAFRILSSCLVIISTSLLADAISPYFVKKERKEDEQAKEEKTVKLNKSLFTAFLSLLIFTNLIGILIIALPKVITEYLEFNYLVTLCVWWIPIIFDDVVFYFMCTKVKYDDEKITVKKLFHKPKEYYYGDIISFTKSGNLKVITKNGSFTLFNAFAGTKSLRKIIAKKKETNDANEIFKIK